MAATLYRRARLAIEARRGRRRLCHGSRARIQRGAGQPVLLDGQDEDGRGIGGRSKGDVHGDSGAFGKEQPLT